MTWIIARLRENSTWRGIVWLMTVAGLTLRPDQADAIMTVGMAFAGLLGVFTSDQPQNVHITPDPPLPPIDLVSCPEGIAQPAVPAQPGQPRTVVDPLRQSVLAQHSAESHTTSDNTYPRFLGGFGDRD